MPIAHRENRLDLLLDSLLADRIKSFICRHLAGDFILMYSTASFPEGKNYMPVVDQVAAPHLT